MGAVVNAVALIPWWTVETVDNTRHAALGVVTGKLDEYGVTARLATYAGVPWSRARAINGALDAMRHMPPEVVILNDADSYVSRSALVQAVEMARQSWGLVRAFSRYVRLGPDGSEQWEQENAQSHGVAAIRYDCLTEVGGYDPAFEGWGYEDLALNLLLESRWESRRVEGTLYHLWHTGDPTSAGDSPYLAANEARYGLYGEHTGDYEALRLIRDEQPEPSNVVYL